MPKGLRSLIAPNFRSGQEVLCFAFRVAIATRRLLCDTTHQLGSFKLRLLRKGRGQVLADKLLSMTFSVALGTAL